MSFDPLASCGPQVNPWASCGPQVKQRIRKKNKMEEQPAAARDTFQRQSGGVDGRYYFFLEQGVTDRAQFRESPWPGSVKLYSGRFGLVHAGKGDRQQHKKAVALPCIMRAASLSHLRPGTGRKK